MKNFIIPVGDNKIRDLATRYVSELDNKKSWIITIKQAGKQRSLHQNAYYWGVVITHFCDHTGFTAEEMHRVLLCECCGANVVVNGKWKVKRPARTTTTGYEGEEDVMSTAQFMSYIDRCIGIAVQMGIHIPDPDPGYWENE